LGVLKKFVLPDHNDTFVDFRVMGQRVPEIDTFGLSSHRPCCLDFIRLLSLNVRIPYPRHSWANTEKDTSIVKAF